MGCREGGGQTQAQSLRNEGVLRDGGGAVSEGGDPCVSFCSWGVSGRQRDWGGGARSQAAGPLGERGGGQGCVSCPRGLSVLSGHLFLYQPSSESWGYLFLSTMSA